jgi:hypothetical protein
MSTIFRKACSWRRSSRSFATGARTTTCAKAEAKLHALPQFITEIDGLDIQCDAENRLGYHVGQLGT